MMAILYGHFANGQLLKKFDIAIAHNYSVVFNKGRFVAQHLSGGGSYKIDTFYDQKPAYFLNFNVSLGFSINQKNTLRLKYGRNNVGVKLTGKSVVGTDLLGNENTFYFKNYINKLEVTFIGMLYQYEYAIENDHLLFSVGIDRQEIHYYLADVLFNDFASPNYAIEASIGYQMELVNQLYITGSFFSINSFSQQNSEVYFDLPSSFAPIQYGIEFALQKSF